MELTIYDKEFELVGVVDAYKSLIWTDRFYKCGDFEITIAATRENILLMKEDFYVFNEKETDRAMIIEETKLEGDIESGYYLIVSGRSLESILARRVLGSQIEVKGKFLTEVKKLITENITSPSDQNRKIQNFVFVDPSDPRFESIEIDNQFSGKNLMEVLETLCESHKVGYKVTLNDQNEFLFTLYLGTDRSYDSDLNYYVVFSKNFDNIISSNYLESNKTYKNVAIVAGEGQGAERKTVTVGELDKVGLERREVFVDARNVSSKVKSETEKDEHGNNKVTTMPEGEYLDKLREKGREKLKENKKTFVFEGKAETTQMYVYGEDFFMGDIVQFENEFGIQYKVRVIEFIRSIEIDGIDFYPTFEVIDKEQP